MPNEDRPARGTTCADDEKMQAAVLQGVLDVNPSRITLPELVREIAGESPDFGDRDAVERAVRYLAGVGLLHTVGEAITPTRAAVVFSRILDC